MDLEKLVEYGRLVVILAPRRYGKSSLLRVYLNTQNRPYILVDARKIISEPLLGFRRVFYEVLSEELTKVINKYKSLGLRIRELFSRVSGVEVLGYGVRLSWSKKKGVRLTTILDLLDNVAGKQGVEVVVAFDELQEFSRVWYRIPSLLAYVYDNLSRIKIVITSSEVGVLYDVLKLSDPSSPLYGRVVGEIRLRKLSTSEARDFLEKGFQQIGRDVGIETIEGYYKGL